VYSIQHFVIEFVSDLLQVTIKYNESFLNDNYKNLRIFKLTEHNSSS